MKKYKIVLFNKKEVEVTEKEFKGIIMSDDLTHISRLNMGINKKGIAHYEEIGSETNITSLLEDRKNNKEGILWDGTRVVRQYGRWCDPNGAYDEKGNMLTCNFDPSYYPEVGRDCVPSPSEYHQKYSVIEDKNERLKAILGAVGYQGQKYLSEPKESGFIKIGEITNKKKN